ncbi:MAG: hypothetical protein ABI120_08980 [Gemmatimonadaceae bacterium]
MISSARIRVLTVAASVLALLSAVPQLSAQRAPLLPWPSGAAKARFEITIPANVRSGLTTGRAYVILSRTNETEPRLQIGRVGAPMFARDFSAVVAGRAITVDGTDLGTPVADMADVPAGEYWVQAVINVYSEFKRADGHTVWMHDDQWEGQKWNSSPGNLYSTPQKMRIDPRAATTIQLSVTKTIPPIVVAADNEYVQRFKIQSPLLTKFWGRPIYIGATVLLPKGYATSGMSYPVNHGQGHFSLAAPYGFDRDTVFRAWWMAESTPRMIAVTFQHPTPYFDDSYAVNSVNSGPYGDAFMQELIPELEKRYRVIKEPWARWLSGGSTGGWESLALQVWHPDFFGGTWSYCADPVTFTDVEGMNLYKDDNAFYKQITEWHRTPTINSREVNGEVRQTAQQRAWMELVNGTSGRSGTGQLDVWSATFGPLGADGYFKPVFDPKTGVIDRSVAMYWKDNYDILEYLKKNWTTVGPKLDDKIHIYTGDMDNFFLDRATHELEAWMQTTSNPRNTGYFVWGDQRGHCYSGPGGNIARLMDMAEHGLRHKPAGTTTPWWKNQ